jgi:hypothetical protein
MGDSRLLTGQKLRLVFKPGKAVQESAMINPIMRSYYVEALFSLIAARPHISILSRPPPF